MGSLSAPCGLAAWDIEIAKISAPTISDMIRTAMSPTFEKWEVRFESIVTTALAIGNDSSDFALRNTPWHYSPLQRAAFPLTPCGRR